VSVLAEGLSFARSPWACAATSTTQSASTRRQTSCDGGWTNAKRTSWTRPGDHLRTSSESVPAPPAHGRLWDRRPPRDGFPTRPRTDTRGAALRRRVPVSRRGQRTRPVQRAGLEWRVTSSALDNPRVRSQYRATSGGSTGAPTYIGMDIQHLVDQAVLPMLTFSAHGTLGAPMLVWRGMMPDRPASTTSCEGFAWARPATGGTRRWRVGS